MAKKVKKIKKKVVKAEPIQKVESIKKTKIRVIGIGGGGGSIVSEIASRMPKASFVVANTDSQALKMASRKVARFQFGQNLTRGLGTGMNPELGREAASQEKDKIKKVLEGQDLCILVACLGGGTGSGAAPIFAKLSKNLGNLTYGIFTLPFKFEGERKMEIARDSLKQVKNYLNAISIIPNERVFQIIDKDTPLKQALSVINRNLAEGLGGLIETLYEPGLINIDFADFKTILEGKGRLAYLNTAEVLRKEGKVGDLITKALNSPLYPYSIKGGKGVLFNIAGERELSLSEVNQISKTIAEMVNPEAKIIFGISQGKKYSNILKTILMVTGCGMKIFPLKKKKKKKIKKKKVESTPKPPKKKRRRRIKRAKPKKVKPKKVNEVRKPKKKLTPKPEVEGKEVSIESAEEEKVRKNALQIRKESQEQEKEMEEKEKFWETPAFLRKKFAKEK